MNKRFPYRWYWRADDGRIYSAKDQKLVNIDDPGYKEFISSGHYPTRWPTDTDYVTQTDETLREVIGKHNLSVTPEEMLTKYANDKHDKVVHGGISVNVAPAGKKTNVIEVQTDVKGLALLHVAYTTALANPAAIVHWKQTNGGLDLSGPQVKTIFAEVQAHIDAANKTRTQVLSAINEGTIKKPSQIDNPPAPISAWPLNS